MQLINEKFTYSVDPTHVSRERLVNLLSENLKTTSATIISARAGTGKTALAAEFATRSGRNVAWFKVESSDADWRVFFRYLVASVEVRRPGFNSGQFAAIIDSSTVEDMMLCAEFFVFDLFQTRTSPLLIVLEDLHLVFDAEWVNPFFSRLLPLLPGDVHLLITCRSLLPAPLWRMRSKQQLCLVDEDNLNFTFEEARQLYESYGLTDFVAGIALEESRGKASMLSSIARLFRHHTGETHRNGERRRLGPVGA